MVRFLSFPLFKPYSRFPLARWMLLLIAFALATRPYWCCSPVWDFEDSASFTAHFQSVAPGAIWNLSIAHNLHTADRASYERCCHNDDYIHSASAIIAVPALSSAHHNELLLFICPMLPEPQLLARTSYGRDGPDNPAFRSHLSRNLLLGRAPPFSV